MPKSLSSMTPADFTRIRRASGMTPAALATYLGRPVKAVWYYAKGSRAISQDIERMMRRLEAEVGATAKKWGGDCTHIHVGAEYDTDDLEFIMAMDRFKREKGRTFPTWSEALAVLKGLGYRKVPVGRGKARKDGTDLVQDKIEQVLET